MSLVVPEARRFLPHCGLDHPRVAIAVTAAEVVQQRRFTSMCIGSAGVAQQRHFISMCRLFVEVSVPVDLSSDTARALGMQSQSETGLSAQKSCS